MNPISGEILLQLDRPRTFRLDWNQMAAFEAQLKALTGERRSFMRFLSDSQDWTVEEMRLLLWIGLKAEDKDLTLERVGEIMGLTQIYSFQFEFGEALKEAMPQRLQKKIQEMRAQSQPGTTSSPSPGESDSSPANSGT